MMRAIPLLLLLGACGPLVQLGDSGPRPDALLTLSAELPTAAPATPITTVLNMDNAVSVALPSAPGFLQTLRIPVNVSDTEIRYVPVAQWSEQPNRLFQRLLADRLQGDGVAVVDLRSSGKLPGRQLTGQLLAFGVDTRGGNRVHIRYDATLADPNGLRQRRFEAEQPVSLVEGPGIAAALNRAANQLAGEVSEWVRTNA